MSKLVRLCQAMIKAHKRTPSQHAYPQQKEKNGLYYDLNHVGIKYRRGGLLGRSSTCMIKSARERRYMRYKLRAAQAGAFLWTLICW
uniref:Ribosomal protein S14 n=1 Tax=Trichogramma kaykai TaxID=54128 RepID=A0ABD2WSZ1_9HYME